MRFGIGDRVRTTADKYCDFPMGYIGTVVAISEDQFETIPPLYGVVFDQIHEAGHDLNGRCEDGYGYWVFEDELEFTEAVEEQELTDILVDDIAGLLA